MSNAADARNVMNHKLRFKPKFGIIPSLGSWYLLPTALFGTWEHAGERGGWFYFLWIKAEAGFTWKRSIAVSQVKRSRKHREQMK